MFVGKVIERDTAVGQHGFDPKRALLLAAAGHDLGAEGDLHLGPGPNVGRGSVTLYFFGGSKYCHCFRRAGVWLCA